MEIFYAIIAGVFVFVISQYFLKLILEPAIELKKTIKMILHNLDYYGPNIDPLVNYHRGILRNDIEEPKRERIAHMREEFKYLSASLLSQMETIVLFDIISKLLFLPSSKNLLSCSKLLKELAYWTDIEEKNQDKKVKDLIESIVKIIKTY